MRARLAAAGPTALCDRLGEKQVRYEKFSSMTAALLARKGEAVPSVVAGQIGPKGIEPVSGKNFAQPLKQPKTRAQTKQNAPVPHRARRAAPGVVAGTKRRIMLTLTNEEFERIGIAAVKRNVSRQQLARDALFAYLSAMALEYEDCSLPIRLTPMIATCRVPPLSRVKLGIGWSRGVARDAEQ